MLLLCDVRTGIYAKEPARPPFKSASPAATRLVVMHLVFNCTEKSAKATQTQTQYSDWAWVWDWDSKSWAFIIYCNMYFCCSQCDWIIGYGKVRCRQTAARQAHQRPVGCALCAGGAINTPGAPTPHNFSITFFGAPTPLWATLKRHRATALSLSWPGLPWPGLVCTLVP